MDKPGGGVILPPVKHSPGFEKLVAAAKQGVREVSVQEVAQRMKTGSILIDVREESEWLAGHALGAIHLSKGVLERDIEGRVPDFGQQLLCYCGGGYRSVLAAENLQRMGYLHVFSVEGGWRAWLDARLPTRRGPEVYPRSPYEKLGGLVHLPRLLDKCRLYPAGMLPGYNYLDTGFDKVLLDFLCLEGRDVEQAAQIYRTDEEMLTWLKMKLGPGWPSEMSIGEFNERLQNSRPSNPDKHSWFDKFRASLPPTRRRVETFFDLIELDEQRFRD
jgi:rhodanese-related sulfurtransferase